MTYDFYGEFWNKRKLMESFLNYFLEEWTKIRENKGIDWKGKVKRLKENLEGDTEFHRQLIDDFLDTNDGSSYIFHPKFQFILKEFIVENNDELKKTLHGILEDPQSGIRGYQKKYRKEIKKLDLSENSKDSYRKMFLNYQIPEEIFSLIDSLSLENPHHDLGSLPKCNFLLHVQFTLDKPYMGKDDEEFYIHENPVSKEKVFKIPYIKASSWKGNLRWAFGKPNDLPENDERLLRIFGNKKGEENPENLRKGRLYTYPTFFNKISLDIINPHDRIARAGKNPITLEVIPKGTEGNLCLLYVAFDGIGGDEKSIKEEIEIDLFLLCKAVKVLLTEYGMSAKRTSGYGAAHIEEISFRSVVLKKYEKYTNLDELIDELERKYPLKAPLGGRTE